MPFILNLLIANPGRSSVHQVRRFASNAKRDELLSLCQHVGITKIALLRHGNTAAPSNGVDFDRVLTDEGRHQAQEAGESFGIDLQPFFPVVLVSPAPRTVETAELFLSSAFSSVDSSAEKASMIELRRVPSLYDGTMHPEGSRIFRKLGYAPLRDYLNCEDKNDRDISRKLLASYSQAVVKVILDLVQEKNEKSIAAMSSVLWIVGHAIYLPSAALELAAIVNCDDPGMETILSTNTREAEGYIVDLQRATAKSLIRQSNQGVG